MANDISLGTVPLSSDNILQPKIVYENTINLGGTNIIFQRGTWIPQFCFAIINIKNIVLQRYSYSDIYLNTSGSDLKLYYATNGLMTNFSCCFFAVLQREGTASGQNECILELHNTYTNTSGKPYLNVYTTNPSELYVEENYSLGSVPGDIDGGTATIQLIQF